MEIIVQNLPAITWKPYNWKNAMVLKSPDWTNLSSTKPDDPVWPWKLTGLVLHDCKKTEIRSTYEI